MGDAARKRKMDASSDFVVPRKRSCIEEFFADNASAEAALQRFHDAVKDLRIESASPAKLRDITQRIRRLGRRELRLDLARPELLKVVKTFINVVKTNSSEGFQTFDETNLTKWADNVEITLESCFVCFFIFARAKNSLADFEEYVNDVAALFVSECHRVQSHLARSRGTSKIRRKLSAARRTLIEDLDLLGEIVRVHDLNSSNTSGLIVLCVQGILYHRDLDAQMSALKAIQSVYGKGEELRVATVGSMLKSVGAVQEHYKFVKNYRINESVSVSVFTVFVTSLVENAPVASFRARKSSSDKSASILRECFEGVMKVGCFVVMEFLRKMATSETGSRSYSTFLSHLVSELIEMSDEPEWPSAKLILNLLAKPLTEVLRRLKPKPEPSLRALSVKILTEMIRKKILDKKIYGKTLDDLQDRFVDEDFVHVARRLVVYHLTRSRGRGGSSKLLHAIQWYDAIKHESDAEERATAILELLTEDDRTACAAANASKHEMNAITYFLDAARFGYADHHVLVKYVLCACYDGNKKVRSQGVRSLLELIDLDVDLLSLSTVYKTAIECLTESSDKEKLWMLVDRYLGNHPERHVDFLPLLVRFPEEESSTVKRVCVELVANLVRNYPSFRCDSALCRKLLGFLDSDDPVTRRRVVDFCTGLWFVAGDDNLSLLLEIVDAPRSAKHLRRIFEEKLGEEKTPTWTNLVANLLARIEQRDANTLRCLRVLSMLVTSRPGAFESNLRAIAGTLRRDRYSDDNAVEILTAEILNCIVPEVSRPDVSVFVALRTDLAERLAGQESLDYTMGLTVSLLKLVGNLSRFDPSYVLETFFRPSVEFLEGFSRRETADRRAAKRALCHAVYLHPRFPAEAEDLDFPRLLSHFIRHRIFGLVTVHSLCYLSVDHKLIMRRDVVTETIRGYLADAGNALFVNAALYNITCSLKNINNGRLLGEVSDHDEQIDAVRHLARIHLKDALNYAFDERPAIRRTAYSLVGQLLVSGLLPDSRLVPCVLLMCADPVDSLSDAGLELLSLVRPESLSEHARSSRAWILSSLRLRTKSARQERIRGYRNRNGRLEAICNRAYVRLREDVQSRRRIVDSIVGGLARDAETGVAEKLYLADHLATFAYKYQEEVYYVVREIEALISATEIPDDDDGFVRRYYGVGVLHHVGDYLMRRYGFGRDRLRKYYHEDGKRDVVHARVDESYRVPDHLVTADVAVSAVDVVRRTLKDNRRKRFDELDSDSDKKA